MRQSIRRVFKLRCQLIQGDFAFAPSIPKVQWVWKAASQSYLVVLMKWDVTLEFTAGVQRSPRHFTGSKRKMAESSELAGTAFHWIYLNPFNLFDNSCRCPLKNIKLVPWKDSEQTVRLDFRSNMVVSDSIWQTAARSSFFFAWQ